MLWTSIAQRQTGAWRQREKSSILTLSLFKILRFCSSLFFFTLLLAFKNLDYWFFLWGGGEFSLNLHSRQVPRSPHLVRVQAMSWISVSLFINLNSVDLFYGKVPDARKDLRAEGEEAIRERHDWMASLMQWTWIWANFGRWWGTGRTYFSDDSKLKDFVYSRHTLKEVLKKVHWGEDKT